jgi:hypothetical protein
LWEADDGTQTVAAHTGAGCASSTKANVLWTLESRPDRCVQPEFEIAPKRTCPHAGFPSKNVFCRICPKNEGSPRNAGSAVPCFGRKAETSRAIGRCGAGSLKRPNATERLLLSDQAIKQAILGSEIEQKVNDCLQDWSGACSDAVKEMMEKQK